ncbi:hypothetical protein B1693_09785 [Geobacillus zalihae]|nr:hypothetical protein B1693_09785 [Geobacillus zalihae]
MGLFSEPQKGVFVYYMDNRSISIQNSTLNNTNLSSGDGNSQSVVTNNPAVEDLFKQLVNVIEKESPEDEKADALENAAKLQEAVNKNDKTRAKRIFNWLPTVVQASSVGVEILKLINSQ